MHPKLLRLYHESSKFASSPGSQVDQYFTGLPRRYLWPIQSTTTNCQMDPFSDSVSRFVYRDWRAQSLKLKIIHKKSSIERKKKRGAQIFSLSSERAVCLSGASHLGKSPLRIQNINFRSLSASLSLSVGCQCFSRRDWVAMVLMLVGCVFPNVANANAELGIGGRC